MGIWAKVGIFILFLVAFATYLYLSRKNMTQMVGEAAVGKYFISEQKVFLMSLFCLFGFTWILSGYFNVWLILLVYLSMQLGPAISAIIWGLIGSPKIPWAQQLTWEGAQTLARHPWIFVFMMALSIIMVIGFPISAGVTYFGNEVPSDEATLSAFRTVIFWFLIFGFILGLPMTALILSSESLHEDTRSLVLVQTFSRFILTGIWLAMALWAYNLIGQGREIEFGSVALTISPTIIISLVVFYLLSYILPYIAGVQRGKRLSRFIHDQEEGWLNKTVEIFKLPADKDERIQALSALRSEIQDQLDDFLSQRRGLQLGLDVDADDSVFQGTDEEIRNLKKAYECSRDFDPRRDYLNACEKYQSEFENIIAKLEQEDDEVRIKEMVKAYAETYSNRSTQLAGKESSGESNKPVAYAVIVSSIASVSTLVLNQVAKWVMEFIPGFTVA